MKKKNVLVFVGHPDTDSSVGMLASEYVDGARAGGHVVRRMNIGEMEFNPILRKGYKEIQELEKDLIQAQENFKWADHIVILYPNWWCSMPAVLKGMFDRMWLPGFAFNFKKDKNGKRTSKLIRLFKNKSARVVVTTGSHPIMIRFHFGDFTNEIIRGILGFSGISPVKLNVFGPIEKASEAKKDKWRSKMYHLGKKAK